MDVVAGLLLLGVGQGLFLAALLILRPQLRTPANLFLAALVGALALSCLDDVLLRTGVYLRMPWAAGLGFLLLPLFGPLLRFYLDALTIAGEWRPSRRHIGWLYSPLIGLALGLAFLTGAPHLRVASLMDRPIADEAAHVVLLLLPLAIYILSAAQQGMALLFGLRLVRRQTQMDAATRSRLLWLRGLLSVAAACWLAYIASLIAGLIDSRAAAVAANWASLLYVLSLYALGVLGLARPDTLLPAPGEIVATILEPARAKYAKSALDQDDARRIAGKVMAAFERDRLHLDPTLTLPRLAAAIGASTNDTSQAINAELGGSFYDLVNRTRIDEAKQRLADPASEDTVLDICFAVGFNSKSVFNAAFKRHVGLTPSAFRERSRAGVALEYRP